MIPFKFSKNTDELFGTILDLRSVKEAESFFRDLCTTAELSEMSDRWQMVRLIDEGVPYRKIASRLKTSTTTVSRVAAWLNNGEGGYRLALDRMDSRLNSQHHRKPFSKKSL